MSKRSLVFTCSLFLGLMMLIQQGIAQQKTVKACREEWRGNKSTNQANGVTEKAYVAQCRGGSTPVPSSAGPNTPTAPAPTTAPPRQTRMGDAQKTAKACREEWQASKAANQANGVTERAYVAQCRAGGSPTAGPPSTAATPTAAAPPVRPTQTVAGQKTIKACREEWQANKAANQANGVTERAYVAECRTGTAPTQPTAAPATSPAPEPTPTAAPAAPSPTAPTAAAPPTRPAVPVPTTTVRPAPPSAPPSTAAAASEFSTEAQAKARCPSDTVVWVTLKSGVYHFAGTRYYGTTKNGAYMCEADSTAAGMHAAKNETHP
jgi:hypothetical protein